MTSFFERHGIGNEFKSTTSRCPRGARVVNKNRPRGTNPTCVFNAPPPGYRERSSKRVNGAEGQSYYDSNDDK